MSGHFQPRLNVAILVYVLYTAELSDVPAVVGAISNVTHIMGLVQQGL